MILVVSTGRNMLLKGWWRLMPVHVCSIWLPFPRCESRKADACHAHSTSSAAVESPRVVLLYCGWSQTSLGIAPTFSGVSPFMLLVLFYTCIDFYSDAPDLGRQAIPAAPFRLRWALLWSGTRSRCAVMGASLWPSPPSTCSPAPNNGWARIKHREMQSQLSLSGAARGKCSRSWLGLNKLSGAQV